LTNAVKLPALVSQRVGLGRGLRRVVVLALQKAIA
jgi:hypothetical protein